MTAKDAASKLARETVAGVERDDIPRRRDETEKKENPWQETP